jgi:hypothetical protein
MPVTVTRYSRPQAFPRRAVRRGASWTAAYHLQLTVAAVARPVGSSVVPSESLLPSGPGLLLAQTASARRSVQPTSSGRASSPWSTLPGRQPRRRSPVGVQHRVSTIGVRRPGVRRSGRLLSTRPVSGPLVSTRPASSRLLSDRAVSSRLVSAPSARTRPSPPIPGGGVGPRSLRRAPVTTGRAESRWAAAPLSGSVDGPASRDTGGAARSRWSVGVGGGPGPGWVRRRVPAERAGRPGRRAQHRWLAA